MDRRDFLKTAGTGLLLGLSGCGWTRGTAAGKLSKPNIIFILADDLGYGDLSCYGQTHFSTPHIDGLAAEGMRFTQHYAGNTVCAPSRCCLMTGLHGGHAAIRGNYMLWPEGQWPLPAESVTVAEKLKEAGYHTALIGKWDSGGPGTSGAPKRQGFDYSFGYLCFLQAHRYYPNSLWRNGEKVLLENNEQDQAVYSPDLFTQEAIEYIRRQRDERFFLYLSYTIPHVDLSVPQETLREFEGRYPETPYPGNGHYVPQASPRAAYAAMIVYLDRAVGRIMALLKELDLDEETLVIFASDNGPTRDGGVDPEFFNSTGGLRGLKQDLYEGGIRVPFIVRWPGRVAAGSTSAHVSALWDFMPTACELAGGRPAAVTDGISLVPTLLGRPETQRKHDYLYWEYSEFDWGRPKDQRQVCYVKDQAIRMGDFKGIRTGMTHNPDAPLALYDLSTDPAETWDIAAERPEIVESMKRSLAAARTDSATWRMPSAQD